jgi:hypothetical protein
MDKSKDDNKGSVANMSSPLVSSSGSTISLSTEIHEYTGLRWENLSHTEN